eukprot:TRINITY_DN3884_c1_g1_i1.p1 TRINITY_DN3884_c1_g1~~TRINITY_DN3884_c1_g1_i1.p1  ORF type:complete len:256 (+),score=59.03 TRINITY_DN3884_c1_g1_i1:45-770(+)
MAAMSPATRALILERLRSQTSGSALSRPGAGEETGAAVETPSASGVHPEVHPAASTSSAGAQVLRKLAEQAAEMKQLREECQGTALRLEASNREAASFRTIAESCQQEVASLRSRVRETEFRSQIAEERLRECQKKLELQQVFISPGSENGAPSLSFRWVDNCQPLSSEPGSANGANRLRSALVNVDKEAPELLVGPPPIDWKVFLQLRLRKTERWEPALLQLGLPGTKDESFVGLLWSTS